MRGRLLATAQAMKTRVRHRTGKHLTQHVSERGFRIRVRVIRVRVRVRFRFRVSFRFSVRARFRGAMKTREAGPRNLTDTRPSQDRKAPAPTCARARVWG